MGSRVGLTWEGKDRLARPWMLTLLSFLFVRLLLPYNTLTAYGYSPVVIELVL